MLALRLTCRQYQPTFRLSAQKCAYKTTRAYSHDPSARHRSREPQTGTTTPISPQTASAQVDAPHTKTPFHLVSAYSGWPKRPSRPFPPPFFSPPSASFSDPLSTYNRALDRRPKVNGQMIRGVTVGDDALLASELFVGVNDGVGAWGQKERGCAPLWSRLVLHFWDLAAEKEGYGVNGGDGGEPDPVRWLDEAYGKTKEALSQPGHEWLGTTTACSALLHSGRREGEGGEDTPTLYVTQLGDCKCLVVRPSRPQEERVIFATKEQWHYFDCPRQLGTNSPDEPLVNAVLSKVELEEDDIVLAMSDGVTDNLWEEEIADTAVESLRHWNEKLQQDARSKEGGGGALAQGVKHVAQEIVLAARKIAEDPFATSPFMERAVDEGLAIEGGKLDDISVVVALCRRRDAG